MKVCLDPGHGGNDSGAVSSRIVEKDINLKVALAVKAVLKERGHEVVMTRDDDINVQLTARGRLSVKSKVDIFVSIHHDCSSNSAARGCSGFYYNESCSNAKDLAVQITTRLHDAWKLPYAYGTPARVHWVSLGVLRGGDNWKHTTACLVECAMLSSDTDATIICGTGYVTRTAQCIADGIEAHAAKEGITTSPQLADAGIIVVMGDEVLTRRGQEQDDETWVPLREVAEKLGYKVTSHIADQGKVYLSK
ncbi:MAG: N-acetylmuramoyl-L-alanine amidase family protein [Armatimonadota bacterium]